MATTNIEKQSSSKEPHLNNYALSAKEKKALGTINNQLGHERNGCAKVSDHENEWKSPEILNLKPTINYECNNSIPINFTEAWSYFQSCDMSAFLEKVEQNPPVGKFRERIRGFVGLPSLNCSLIPERNLILAVASCPMNNDCSVHRRILQSIYVFMTKRPSCSRYGSHWEEVGFQGQDPASDLRGVGIFGALQMLYLSSAQETKETLATEVFELSRHPIHQFPLAVLSLNVTKMTLDTFRNGILNRFCNKECSPISVVNRFYLAIMYRIYKKWKFHRMTIHDSCFLLKSVEKWCRSNPQKTLVKLNAYLEKAQNKNGTIEGKKLRKKNDESESSLSWLDLTKPSLEVFI